MEKRLELIVEVLELIQDINKNLSLSEYLVNEGEVQESMAVLKRGTSTLKTCVKDCFLELEEEFNLEKVEVDEDPSVCNLIASLSELGSACVMLLKEHLGENGAGNISLKKASTSLAKVKDLTGKLFD